MWVASGILVIGAVGMALTNSHLSLGVLMLRPVCLAKTSRLSVFSSKLERFVKRKAKSSADSRSFRWEKKLHWMPLGISEVVVLMVQWMMTRKRMGERIHPCLTPYLTWNHSERGYYYPGWHCIQSRSWDGILGSDGRGEVSQNVLYNVSFQHLNINGINDRSFATQLWWQF